MNRCSVFTASIPPSFLFFYGSFQDWLNLRYHRTKRRTEALHTCVSPWTCDGLSMCRDSCSTPLLSCVLGYVTEFCASAFPECDSFLHESVMLRHVDLPPVFSLTCSVLLVLLEECKDRKIGTVALI